MILVPLAGAFYRFGKTCSIELLRSDAAGRRGSFFPAVLRKKPGDCGVKLLNPFAIGR